MALMLLSWLNVLSTPIVLELNLALIAFVCRGKTRDSFAQLRDEEAELKAELKSRCVICGISRNEFDRGGNVFYDHITRDHCM